MSFESRVLAFKNLFDEIMRRTPLVEGKTFRGEYVNVDFNRYKECKFVNCTLVFEFGVCSLIDCTFDRNCKFEAKEGSPASAVLKFDRELKESAFKERFR